MCVGKQSDGNRSVQEFTPLTDTPKVVRVRQEVFPKKSIFLFFSFEHCTFTHTSREKMEAVVIFAVCRSGGDLWVFPSHSTGVLSLRKNKNLAMQCVRGRVDRSFRVSSGDNL